MTRVAIVPGAVSGSSLRALVLTLGAPAHPGVTLAADGRPAQAVQVEQLQPPAAIASILAALGARAYRIALGNLAHDTRYTLQAAVDAVGARVALRTLPARLPADGFTFAVASCHYRGFSLQAQIAAALRDARLEKPAAALLMLGDNLYVDQPPPTGRAFDLVRSYVDHLFDPGFLSVRAQLPAFTTWDDHELWNDFPEPQINLPFTRNAQAQAEHRSAALACIDFFQASVNPPRAQPRGRSYTFELAPLRFFVADTRTQRTRAGAAAPGLLEEGDLLALEQFLRAADGPCVLCLGQPLWMPARSSLLGFTTDHNPPAFRAHYERIWAALRSAFYDVLVLAGDVHYSRLLRIAPGTVADNRAVWECTASPLCHIPTALGSSQGTTTIEDPARVPELPLARAQYRFGTTANANFGLLHFRPGIGHEVRVGVSFVDARSGRPAAPVRTTALGGVQPSTLQECHQPNAFALRLR